MESKIKALFKDKEDAEAAVSELKILGVDKVIMYEESEFSAVEAEFSGVTGVRNVFEKRNAHEIIEEMPERV